MSEKKQKYLHTIIPAALLCLFFLFSFASMLKQSVTVDEFMHLPSGHAYLKTADFHINNYNPPLIKMLAALPLLFKGVDFIDTESLRCGSAWGYGYDFMDNHMDDYHRIFVASRIVIILIGLLGGYFIYIWTKQIYGYKSACLALFFYAFSPNIIAHSSLVTTDMGAGVFMLMALYFIYKWHRDKTWPKAVVAGLFLGFAQLTKFTSIILYLSTALFFTVYYIIKKKREGRTTLKRDYLKLIVIILISLLILNAGYLFKGAFSPLDKYEFKSKFMQSVERKLPDFMPVPLPGDYVEGFDWQKEETEGKYPYYLMGRFSTKGWWYYYPAAFIFKAPLALIILLIFLTVCQFGKKLPVFKEDEFIIGSFIFLYTLICMLGVRHNLGFRYMLPVLPLIYILTSRVLLLKIETKYSFILVFSFVLTYGIASIGIFPHYLSFFNSLAGGPRNGYNYLLDSNIDWGQDLISLKEYMTENKIEEINLAYFGRVDPTIYGIKYKILTRETRGGIAAVSVNYYQGMSYFLLDGKKTITAPSGYYKYLQDYPIKDRVGYSILIFDLEPEPNLISGSRINESLSLGAAKDQGLMKWIL